MSPFTKFLAACLTLLCMAASFSADLFEDKVVAKGKGIVIKESDVDKAFIAHKAAAAAMGQPVGLLDSKLKEQILEKMIATRMVIARATPSDKEEGKRLAEKLIAEGKRRAGNPVDLQTAINCGRFQSRRVRRRDRGTSDRSNRDRPGNWQKGNHYRRRCSQILRCTSGRIQRTARRRACSKFFLRRAKSRAAIRCPRPSAPRKKKPRSVRWSMRAVVKIFQRWWRS